MARESCIRMRGVWDARHWIRIPGLSHEADVEAIERGLGDLPGIRKVLGYPNRRKIRVIKSRLFAVLNRMLDTARQHEGKEEKKKALKEIVDLFGPLWGKKTL